MKGNYSCGMPVNDRPRDRPYAIAACNVAQVSFVAPIIIDTAVGAIHHNIGAARVLVHCNQGFSRSPSIALLYLLKHTNALGSRDYTVALDAFRALYPAYLPAQGMADYVRINWGKYLPME